MTIAVDWDVNPQTTKNKTINSLKSFEVNHSPSLINLPSFKVVSLMTNKISCKQLADLKKILLTNFSLKSLKAVF